MKSYEWQMNFVERYVVDRFYISHSALLYLPLLRYYLVLELLYRLPHIILVVM